MAFWAISGYPPYGVLWDFHLYNFSQCHPELSKHYSNDFCNSHQVVFEFLNDKSKLVSKMPFQHLYLNTGSTGTYIKLHTNDFDLIFETKVRVPHGVKIVIEHMSKSILIRSFICPNSSIIWSPCNIWFSMPNNLWASFSATWTRSCCWRWSCCWCCRRRAGCRCILRWCSRWCCSW